MANAVQARQLAAADNERQWDDYQAIGRTYDAVRDGVLSQSSRAAVSTAAGSRTPLPVSVSVLSRPGMGRQISSVSNLIDAYRNSPTMINSASSSIVNDSRRTSMNVSNSAPTSPSSASQRFSQSPSHPPRSQYYSEIITRRASVQISGSPRASSSTTATASFELSPLFRERRPSAPDILSPPTRLMFGAAPHGWTATTMAAPSASSSNSNNMTSMIDIKRLRSKPAPSQSHQSSSQASNSQSSTLASAPTAAAMPKHDLDTLISPLTTMLHGTQISASSSHASSTSGSHGNNSNSRSSGSQNSHELFGQQPDSTASSAVSSSRQRQAMAQEQQQQQQLHHRQQRQTSSSNNTNDIHHSTLLDSAFLPENRSHQHHHQPPQSREESSNTSFNAHVDSSLYHNHNHNTNTGRSRFDSSTSISDSGTSQSYTLGSNSGSAAQQHPRPPSPQTPRKIRNSSLPMGTSPSISSSPNPGRQSPTSHRRPLKPIVPTSYPVLLPGQPSLPPSSPKDRSNFNTGDMYESILPTSSTLRPHRQPSSDNVSANSHHSSSFMVSSPEQNPHASVTSPTRTRKDPGGVLSPTSPTPPKKLVRKISRGHLRKDSGTSGHVVQASTSNQSASTHSRSLSLPRTSSRAGSATPTGGGGGGSGSGSEQDDSTLTSSTSHSHFFTQRPAWLDQDPAASTSIPPLPTNPTTRIKSPQQQHPLLSYSISSKNRSLTSLHQQYTLDDAGLDPSPFGPSSLPSTSTLAHHHPHRDHSQASTTASSQPKRKPSFYKRKRSQTATGAEKVDSNGFPIPSPMSEIIKSMPLHERISHDVLQPPAVPPKRNNNNSSSSGSGGGFLSSITRKLSHPNIKDPSPTFEPVTTDPSSDYFTGAYPQPPEKSHTHPIIHHHHSSPKLGSSFTSRSWRNPFGGDSSKNDSKALPQLPSDAPNASQQISNAGKSIYGDPFSASSTISLPGFLHRSPRKDSLSSDKSEQSNGHRRRSPRGRTVSQDGDSSDGHSSEVGYTSLRGYDLAPPVPEVPFGMRNAAGSPPSASTLPKASAGKKIHGLLRSPSLGSRGKKAAVVDLDLSPTTPRAAVFNSGINHSNDASIEDALPSPTRTGMLVISKANESLNSARRKGLGSTVRTSSEDTESNDHTSLDHDHHHHQAASRLGSVAAMDKIATIENNLKEAKFMALWDRSERADKGVIKLSLASSAARDAGIA